MPERYLWTPWDIDDNGAKTWPVDFHRIQNAYKRDTTHRSIHNVHSLKSVGRLVVVEGPNAYINDYLVVPEVIDIGESLSSARAWVEAGRHTRASELLTHFETALAPARKQDPTDKVRLLSRFLPDQLKLGLTSGRRGTFNETWTGTTGDAWPSDWTITKLDTLDLSTAAVTGHTIEIQANEGAADGPVGGLFKQSGFTFAYNGDTATDMNVAYKTIDRGVGGPAVRIEAGGGFDSFYYFNTHSQSGNDTRGYRVVDETRTEEVSDSRASSTNPRWQRLVVENNGSGDPVLDYTEWTVTEPGTPTVSHTDTEIDAITVSGHGGFYDTIARNAVRTYDDFEMTNNDQPGLSWRRRMLSMGVG